MGFSVFGVLASQARPASQCLHAAPHKLLMLIVGPVMLQPVAFAAWKVGGLLWPMLIPSHTQVGPMSLQAVCQYQFGNMTSTGVLMR